MQFRRWGKQVRRAVFVAVGAGALVVVATTSAFAHDCFVANRSSKGALQAGTNSKNWIAIDVVDEFAGQQTPACKAAIQAALQDAGLPTVVATRIDKVLLEGTGAEANGNTENGKGVEHFSESPVTDAVGTTVFTTLETSPAC